MEAVRSGGWDRLEGISERDRQLSTVADKLSRTPTRMVEADWQPLRVLGFDDQACLEVGHIVGLFNHLTRLADGFGLALDAGTRRAAAGGEPLRRAGEE
ncbi:MAG: hypothetical protein ACNA7W_03475 [Pseudomonadales bacterium]